MSVLAMTMQPPGSRECLKFKLSGSNVDVASWGHEYVRSLAGEISEEYNQRSIESPAEDEADVDDLLELVDDMVPFQMQHNAEAEAVDLLMEVQQLRKLVDSPVVDERNYERVCLYLLRCAEFVSDPEDLYNVHSTAFEIYKAQKKYTDALRVALKMGNDVQSHEAREKLDELFSESLNVPLIVRKQMAFILARHRSSYITSNDEQINEIIANVKLSEMFLGVARDMDVLEPKHPDDIYKISQNAGGLAATLLSGSAAQPAKMNIASTFVNAFANAGFGNDKLLTGITDASSSWIFKNLDHGRISAAAAIGMIKLWDVESNQIAVDVWLNNDDENIKAGAVLAWGIASSGIRHENDAALAVLSEQLTESKSEKVRISAICGLGIAYAGTSRDEIKDHLLPIISSEASITEISFAMLALGLVFTGACDEDIAAAAIEKLMLMSEDDHNHTMSRFLCVGLGLLFLGRMELAEGTLEAIRTVELKRGKYADITVQTCAYAGSGNVLKVQSMLHICAEHLTENAEHQAIAVLGIALTTIGEDVGTEMTLRTFEHLLHYSELPVKRMVPLALGLLYLSNPDYAIIDQLSRLSHDQDSEISQNAIFGLGLISAGSNNSRVAGLFRQLSEFYVKEPNHLFIVKIAQGLNHMGKGLIGINPFHSDRLLMSGPAMGGILIVLHAFMDSKATLLDRYHFILYFLTVAMNPRFVSLVDEDLKPVATSVRVGQAVETVGQAGRPKRITGFETHVSPVLIGYKDRAELAGKEYIPVTSIIEGVVIVEKAPEEADVAMAL